MHGFRRAQDRLGIWIDAGAASGMKGGRGWWYRDRGEGFRARYYITQPADGTSGDEKGRRDMRKEDSGKDPEKKEIERDKERISAERLSSRRLGLSWALATPRMSLGAEPLAL